MPEVYANLPAAALADILREAAAAHHDYEIARGKPDADWANWYALWITDRYALRVASTAE